MASLSEEERRRIIERNLDYVRALAATIAARLPQHVALEDLVAYGNEGLVEAAKRFDPSRGASFSTFAYYRIRGAIFDGLRKMSTARQSKRGEEWDDVRFAAAANELLSAAHARDIGRASEQDASPKLEKTLAELSDLFADASVVFLAATQGGRAELAMSATFPDEVQARRDLSRAIERLSQRERDMIRLVYLEDLSLQEAGQQLGLSRSWTSRLHARAVRQLREALHR